MQVFVLTVLDKIKDISLKYSQGSVTVFKRWQTIMKPES